MGKSDNYVIEAMRWIGGAPKYPSGGLQIHFQRGLVKQVGENTISFDSGKFNRTDPRVGIPVWGWVLRVRLAAPLNPSSLSYCVWFGPKEGHKENQFK